MIKKSLTNNLFFSLMLVLCCSVSLAQNTWAKRASVGGSKRERGVGFAIGNRGYIGLGQDTLNLMTNDFWEYDPGTNSWTQKATFPGAARRDAVGFSIGNKGYVGTGMTNADALLGTPMSDFWQYDPATNTWTSKATFPGYFGYGIYYGTGFSIGSKGYICGGKSGPAEYSNELWEYDPSLDAWTQKAYYPGGNRYGATAFVIGSMGYFGTGSDENVFTKDFYRYDPSMDSWTPIASLPASERFSCSAFSLEGEGYILFGSDGGYKSELWEYDPATDFWVSKSAFPGGARRSSAAFAISGRAYTGTGKGLTGTRRDFWVYLPSLPLGINENTQDAISSVYPNPMIDHLTVILSDKIRSSYQKLNWDITDISGKQIQSSDALTNQTITIERNGISSGIYFFNLKSSDRTIATKKIIVQ